MIRPTTATINEKSSRAAEWLEVFGSHTIKIKSPVAHKVNVLDTRKEAYMLDLDALAPEQMERLVKHIAWKFHVLPSVAEKDLREIGCPILAEDVIVSLDMRHVL
jgi:hypothetical protein